MVSRRGVSLSIACFPKEKKRGKVEEKGKKAGSRHRAGSMFGVTRMLFGVRFEREKKKKKEERRGGEGCRILLPPRFTPKPTTATALGRKGKKKKKKKKKKKEEDKVNRMEKNGFMTVRQPN